MIYCLRYSNHNQICAHRRLLETLTDSQTYCCRLCHQRSGYERNVRHVLLTGANGDHNVPLDLICCFYHVVSENY